jgi:hypothetical protein
MIIERENVVGATNVDLSVGNGHVGGTDGTADHEVAAQAGPTPSSIDRQPPGRKL